MDSLATTLHVSWPHRIWFTDRVFAPDNPRLQLALAAEAALPVRTLVVLDAGLHRAQPGLTEAVRAYFDAHSPTLRLVCPPLIHRGGEQAKNSWTGVARLHTAIAEHRLDRQACLVAVGGGALLDVAGLAAATAHRGLRHVRLPSTTLSQCDSGIGVKNGVNALGRKNFIGTFAPPWGVINDFQLLSSLRPRDRRNGYAEAVKVACIRSADFFDDLERSARLLRRFEPGALRQLVQRCAELHFHHIATCGDPFESSSVRPLDFGHWAAHKLEQLSHFRLRHGEAVAIGIALDIIYSNLSGLLPSDQAERVLNLLEHIGFKLFTPELLANPGKGWPLLDGLREFQEHLGGPLTITLLRRIGTGIEVDHLDPKLVRQAAEALRRRSRVGMQ